MAKATGFIEHNRKDRQYIDVKQRLKNFKEFTKPLNKTELKNQASRCMDCGIPYCHSGCPVNNIIPDWNNLVYEGDFKKAIEVLHSTNNFPEFTGRICPAPCEAACTLNIEDTPVTIKTIECSIVDKAWSNGWIKPEIAPKKINKSIAIIGSGPAGLAAAQQLARIGYKVTVFEKNKKIGGLLRYGIPDFKMEKSLIDRRIDQMRKEGVNFNSDTDTEVLVQFMGYLYDKKNLNFFDSLRLTLKEVVGAYGIVAVCQDEPDKIIAARNGSPLVLGLGEDENFVGSDISAIMEHTRNVLYLDDGEIVEITKDGYSIKHIEHDNEIIKDVKEIEFTLEQIEKGDYKHFMLKEIFEQPSSIEQGFKGRVDSNNIVRLGGVYDWTQEILSKDHVYMTACGTSWHAAQIGSYILESVLKKPVKVEYASEFRYRNKHLNSNSLVIAISQSGETADTLSAIKKAKEYGALTLGVVNVVGSSIARETDCGIYMHAGPEIGVASTKAFTSQVLTLSLLGNYLGQAIGYKQVGNIVSDIKRISIAIDDLLKLSDKILEISKKYANALNFLYLGRGYQFPVALEGALKLKEISYIHAEGYPAAEMKHGPIALIDEKMPVVAIVTDTAVSYTHLTLPTKRIV